MTDSDRIAGGTTADLLQLVRDRIPEALVSPAQYERMLRLSACIPAAFVSAAGAECRLAADDGAADMTIAVNRYGFERYPESEPPSIAASAWQSIWRFGRRWGADSDRHLNVGALFLEFDTSKDDQLPVPNVLVSLKPEPSTSALTATVSKVLDAMELRVAPGALTTLTRLAASVKEHLCVLHVGAMMARSDGGLRVCMRVTERSGVHRAVEALGCHGAADEIRKWQQDGAARALTGMLLSFDVLETIGERVGIECVVQPAIPWDTRGYRALLDYLVVRGLCDPTKRDAILRMCDGRMPRIPYATRMRMLRCLSHFKILTTPGGGRSAKVYFYAFALQGTPGIDGSTVPSETCPSGELHATPA